MPIAIRFDVSVECPAKLPKGTHQTVVVDQEVFDAVVAEDALVDRVLRQVQLSGRYDVELVCPKKNSVTTR